MNREREREREIREVVEKSERIVDDVKTSRNVPKRDFRYTLFFILSSYGIHIYSYSDTEILLKREIVEVYIHIVQEYVERSSDRRENSCR